MVKTKKKGQKKSITCGGRKLEKPGIRTDATKRRLKMYVRKPKRDRKGKIFKYEFQSTKKPSTRIQPDLRWFQNSRVIDQTDLQKFQETLKNRKSNNYSVIFKEKKHCI